MVIKIIATPTDWFLHGILQRISKSSTLLWLDTAQRRFRKYLKWWFYCELSETLRKWFASSLKVTKQSDLSCIRFGRLYNLGLPRDWGQSVYVHIPAITLSSLCASQDDVHENQAPAVSGSLQLVGTQDVVHFLFPLVLWGPEPIRETMGARWGIPPSLDAKPLQACQWLGTANTRRARAWTLSMLPALPPRAPRRANLKLVDSQLVNKRTCKSKYCVGTDWILILK